MHLWTLGSFVFFTGLVGLVTWLLTRGDRHDTSTGYFLAGRTLTGGYIAGSLLLTNLSTEQLVGLNGAAFTDGLAVMAWEVIAGCSLVVMALFFLPRYLKSGIATVPQFLEERFDGHTRSITSLIFIIAYAGILLPIILYTGATGMNGILNIRELTGIPSATGALWFMVWLIGILGSIYAIFGGLRSVAVSDTLNGFGLLVGGVMISWFGLQSINADAPLAALETLTEQHPEHFNSLGGPQSSVPFSTLFTGVLLLNLFYWCTNQQIIQRTFAASNLKEGQKGVLYAGILKVLAPLILVLPGIIAFHRFGMYETGDETGQTAQPIVDITSGPATAVVRGDDGKLRILGGDDAAGAQVGGTLTYRDEQYAVQKVLGPGMVVTAREDGSFAYHSDASAEELKGYIAPRDKDRAYGRLVRDVLPPWLAGFFAAVMVGAILSSFNSALNSTATLFSLGVYKHLRPTASEEQVIGSGKVFGWVIAVTSMTVAPLLAGQESIFGYLQKMNGLYFIPIFAVVLVGMLSKRVPAAAANIALVLGFTTIALGYFVPPLAKLVERMHEFHFLGAVFALLILFQLAYGALRPRQTPWVHHDSGEVDLTPWRYAKPAGFALIAFVLTIYIYFANPAVIGGREEPAPAMTADPEAENNPATDPPHTVEDVDELE
jgi:SSS family solute:Na+ symporter